MSNEMNALEQQLVEMLKGATNVAGEAKDFLVSEIPDVAQQALYWFAAKSAVDSVIALVLIAILGWTAYKLPKTEAFKKALEASDGIAWGVYILYIFPAMPIFDKFNLVWLKIWIAPKLFLIEYAASLAK